MTSSSPSSSDSLRLFALDAKRRISYGVLRDILPDVATALFFAKVYGLDYVKLGQLLMIVHDTDVMQALMEGTHSTELQGYIVDTVPPDVLEQAAPLFDTCAPQGEVLPEIWAALEIEVASSIKEVAETLAHTFDIMPGKQGKMVFESLMQMNKRRPTLGTHAAHIKHERVAANLVILDVSGSMTSQTVRLIINDVVALSWKANAHFAIVSEDTFVWDPGTYSVDDILSKAQFSGTHYETLTPLLQRDWGTVVTVADFDSSLSAKDYINDHAHGYIDTVLDISLVDRPTFLAECVGQLATKVRPVLIASAGRQLMR